MAPHSSTLAWKIPWMEEPGRPQSMGSWRVGHDWATSLSLFTFMHWRRKWQPTPVLLPGESQEWGSLVGCRLWSRTELDTTEVTCSSSSWNRGFPGSSVVKNLTANAGDMFNSWVGKIPWRRKWQLTPLYLPEKPHGHRSWQATVHEITQSRTRLSD